MNSSTISTPIECAMLQCVEMNFHEPYSVHSHTDSDLPAVILQGEVIIKIHFSYTSQYLMKDCCVNILHIRFPLSLQSDVNGLYKQNDTYAMTIIMGEFEDFSSDFQTATTLQSPWNWGPTGEHVVRDISN